MLRVRCALKKSINPKHSFILGTKLFVFHLKKMTMRCNNNSTSKIKLINLINLFIVLKKGVFLAAIWTKSIFYNIITIQASFVFS